MQEKNIIGLKVKIIKKRKKKQKKKEKREKKENHRMAKVQCRGRVL